MESLFTNVSIKKSINIFLERICIDKTITITVKKRSMKKLKLDTCTKTAFMFNRVIYEQRDAVCMGSSLASLLASIIMTDLCEKIIKSVTD